MASPKITPFKIGVPEAAIQRLKEKLAAASFTDETLFTDSWDYGAPLSDVKRLAERWRDGFDWRAQEAKLNEVPQFTTKVDVDGFGELNIHFVYKSSSRRGAIPLLFCHGWPGSFYEVLKILPLLTEPEDPEAPAFDVVAPSLPNFGFSDGVSKKGFSISQYAETLHKVMLNLEYDKYVTQGGDWGYIITRLIGAQYPSHCLASHVNFVRVTEAPKFTNAPLLYLRHALAPYTALERAGRDRSAWFLTEGTGYNLEQSTRPSTLGFALADSPVALLAWVYEKLHDWTDGPYPWQDDEVLTWLSIYAFSTAGPAASVRIYYEAKHAGVEQTQKGFEYVPGVKLGVSIFPKDVLVPPLKWAEGLGPLVFGRMHERGGHFAAHERPETLVADLREMFGRKGGAGDVAKVFRAKL
ncbi:hypothetical protein PCL_04895 [Purpureocillium lilacinum]|uniref:Epoxide hydrolase N-terminal domain-containing protein n=1 Tax=Purpureocillium lilacinum TaxID=33203 RepID=A0A2U3DW69_PURLI|nr:hypothetical protein PCL_04895 [Purpureocillium lilacinum]